MEFRKIREDKIHEESLKAKTARKLEEYSTMGLKEMAKEFLGSEGLSGESTKKDIDSMSRGEVIKFLRSHDDRWDVEASIHEESLKALAGEFVQPWDYEKIKKFIFEDEKLTQWITDEVQDVTNLRQVNYFIRDHALALAQAINHKMAPINAVKKANDDSVFTVEPGEEFHCPYCGVRIVEDVYGEFIGEPGVIYTAQCRGCHKTMSVEIDTETTEAYGAVEGSLKITAGGSPLEVYNQYLARFMNPTEDKTFKALLDNLDSGKFIYVSASINSNISDEIWIDYELKYGGELAVNMVNNRVLWHTIIREEAANNWKDKGRAIAEALIAAFDVTYKKNVEGSLKTLKAAPEFQMEMQLGEILSPPYETQTALYITELLKQQSESSIPLPEGFSVDIPDFGSDYHANSEPIEGFPGAVAVHEWYYSGKFEIFDSLVGHTVGYGDFSVDGLWNSDDSEVVGNSLTILNLRPMEENEGNDPDNEPSMSSWARD